MSAVPADRYRLTNTVLTSPFPPRSGDFSTPEVTGLSGPRQRAAPQPEADPRGPVRVAQCTAPKCPVSPSPTLSLEDSWGEAALGRGRQQTVIPGDLFHLGHVRNHG